MAQAGQKPTNAVSTNVAAVANANHVTSPTGTAPTATATPTMTPATIRVARSQVGRLRFKKNIVNSRFEVDDAYLEAAAQQMDSQISKKSQKNFFSKNGTAMNPFAWPAPLAHGERTVTCRAISHQPRGGLL
jgi:hypothetical protein